MNNNSILLIDPNFDPTNSFNLSLWVKIGTDTFSYTIIDEAKKLVHAVYDEQECESGHERLNERLKTDPYLKLNFKEVKVATYTSNIAFIPQELFDKDNVDVYTKYFVDTNSNNIYVQPTLRETFNIIFSLPKDLEELIDENWQNNIKLQQNAGLVELASKIKQNALILDFTVGSFQLIYINDGKLIFMQSYQFDDNEELIYYLLLTINQLGIDAQQITIKICGIINEGDEKWNCLLQYFSKIDTLVLYSTLDTNILDDMPAHYYTSLLALQQCG